MTGIIPARMGSHRFYGKVLCPIGDTPMLERVYRNSLNSALLDDLFVASGDEEILEFCSSRAIPSLKTVLHHATGLERVGEVLSKKSNIQEVLHIQADEAFMEGSVLDVLISFWKDNKDALCTLKTDDLSPDDFRNFNVVKVLSQETGRVIRFARSCLPVMPHRVAWSWWRHIGVYAYSRSSLERVLRVVPNECATFENLEQCRFEQAGFEIYAHPGPEGWVSRAIDVPEQLSMVNAMLSKL